MLTCDEVVALLPGAEAGEPASGDVRDHLATCESCRASAAAIRTDLSVIREDLAALAPSPFLEERVLAGLDEPERVTVRRIAAARRGPSAWVGAAIALAAAVLLAGAVWLAQTGAEVGNDAPDVAAGDEKDGKADAKQDASDQGPSEVEVPLPPRAFLRAHKPEGVAKDRMVTLMGARPEGMALLGRDMLALLGPDDSPLMARRVERAYEALLRQTGGDPVLDVHIVGPGGRAATVRARVDRRYTGSLLIGEPLGRALGLRSEGLAGRLSIAGDVAQSGRRAAARVLIKKPSYDATIEVQVEGLDGAQPAFPLRPGGLPLAPRRIEIRGERPDMGFVGTDLGIHHMHGEILVSADRNVPFPEDRSKPARIEFADGNTLQAALEYKAGKHPLCYVVLPSVDIGGGGPLAWRMTLERVTLTTKFEPGAEVAVARVWRGRTAIPSRESAAFTLADDKGRVSFVHTSGEAGPLKIRERRKDGSVRWHSVDLNPVTPMVIAQVDRDGFINVRGETFHVIPDPAKKTWPRHDEAAMRDLRDLLAGIVAENGPKPEAGQRARLRLVVQAHPQSEWAVTEMLMLACVSPAVQIGDFRFEARGQKQGGVRWLAATDRGLSPTPPDGKRTKAFRFQIDHDGTSTRWRGKTLPGTDHRLQSEEDWKAFAAWVQEFRTEILKSLPYLRPRLQLGRGRLPYGDVQRALRILTQGGFPNIPIQAGAPR